MAREIEEDFRELTNFIKNYKLAGLVEDESYRFPLKQGHTAYLALLTLWAEIHFRCSRENVSILNSSLANASPSMSFIQEAVSDVGSSLFCCLHGAYKPGHMALRSAIENYVRAITGLFVDDALTVTSVYELFDMAKTAPPFLTVDGKPALERLQNSYKELCKYSHSATLAHMAGIKSLDHFPTVDGGAFSVWSKEIKTTVSSIISSYLASAPKFYRSCHFRSRDVLDPCISKEQRLRLLGAE